MLLADCTPGDFIRMSKSIWLETRQPPSFPSLSGDIQTDVAIVGGGLTGIVAAYLLAREGKKVVVLEGRRIGHGETGHTTAHLTEMIDAGYSTISKQFGKSEARQVARASRLAIETIATIAERESIDCRFRRLPAFLYTERKERAEDLVREAAAASEAGIRATYTKEVPLPYPVIGAIRFEGQADYHSLAFLSGVASAAVRDGVTFHEDTKVLDVSDGDPTTIKTERGVVRATDVLLTANVPVNQRGILQTKLPAYRSYAVAALLTRALEPGLYWDDYDPYHYVRTLDIDGSVWLIAGGEDHRTGVDVDTEECFAKLESWTREKFGVERFDYRWSGQIIEPPDGLPYIGRVGFTEHVWVSTGYSGQGMTFGTFGGTMLTDLVLGRKSEWEDLFDPKRIPPMQSMGEYLKDNIEFPKRLIADRLTDHDAEGDSEKTLARGEGKILELDGKKVAAARDENGALHLLSPVCTHMACDVHFNAAEKTWDCPCHGSRFGIDGAVINGPASKPLARIDKTS